MLAAASVTLVVASAGAGWMGFRVFDGQMAATAELARNQATTLTALTELGTSFSGDYGPLPYELVRGSGSLLSSSAVLKPYETRGRPLLPAPGFSAPTPLYRTWTHAFPAGRDDALAGRTVRAVDSTSGPPSGEAGPLVRAYVFITTEAADRALGNVLPFLVAGVPLAVLLVAVTAAAAVSRPLRAVEAIRARTAAVTASDPHERVTIPDTGDEIEALARTINDTLARIESVSRQQRRFVADAAHELRTPITALLAELEIAGAYPSTIVVPDLLARLRRSTERVATITADLLAIARLDAGAPVRPYPLRLDLLLEEVIDAHRAIALTGKRDLRLHAAETIVLADEDLLRRALHNLLANALNHARRSVRVSTVRHGDVIAIEVADDGPGIPENDRQRVFDRFVRLDDARARDNGGSGLGLSFVREAATAMHGDVEIVGPLPGARLRLRLPSAPTPSSPERTSSDAER